MVRSSRRSDLVRRGAEHERVSPHAGAHAAAALPERRAHLSEHRLKPSLYVPRLDAQRTHAASRKIRVPLPVVGLTAEM